MIYTYETDDKYCDIINKVYGAVLKYHSLDDIFDVEISFVDEDEIKRVNKETREIDSVTDVLSFPNLDIRFPFNKDDYKYDIDYESGNVILGDIIICKARMLEQAEEYGHSDIRECAYLTVHGLLHLLGYDHIEDSDRVKMRKAEEDILGSLGITRE